MDKIAIHKRNLKARLENMKKDKKIQKDELNFLLKFLKDLELGKVNKGKKISEARQLKYTDMLKIPMKFFKKSFSKLTNADIERFEKRLSSSKYAHSTKTDIRRALKVYLRWRLGEKGRKLTEWLDTRDKTKTPEYLTEKEIIKLYKSCRTAEQRFLIAVLFDAGCRAEEFHNLRYEDVKLPTGNDQYVKITLKEEYSKTKGRTISLYWIYSLEVVKDYLKEREIEGIKSKEVLFNKKYDNARQFLRNLGEKILNKKIHYHLFRHSSATYYASKLNRQQLCYRYGWTFSSDMPDVYISRAGMNNQELDERFKGTDLEEVKKAHQKLKTDFQMYKEETGKNIKELLKHFENYQDLLNDLAETGKIPVNIKKQSPEQSNAIKNKLILKYRR